VIGRQNCLTSRGIWTCFHGRPDYEFPPVPSRFDVLGDGRVFGDLKDRPERHLHDECGVETPRLLIAVHVEIFAKCWVSIPVDNIIKAWNVRQISLE
jgi:hypothetical protein